MVARQRRWRSNEKAENRPAYRRRNGKSGVRDAAPGAWLGDRKPAPGGTAAGRRRYSRCTARPNPRDHSSALDCCVSYSASTYCTRML